MQVVNKLRMTNPTNNKTIANDKRGQCEGMCVCVGGGGIVWLGAKYFETLSFCHQIISDPNQSPSDMSSDVPLEIISSPGHTDTQTD